jgi:hypothetical protein
VDIGSATCDAITHLKYYSGEFDVEWAQDIVYDGPHPWHTKEMVGYRAWLERNGFDLNDAQYNYGYHPVGQVELLESFGTTDAQTVWPILSQHLDIYQIIAGGVTATYDYAWTDPDYHQQQISRLKPGYDYSSRG